MLTAKEARKVAGTNSLVDAAMEAIGRKIRDKAEGGGLEIVYYLAPSLTNKQISRIISRLRYRGYAVMAQNSAGRASSLYISWDTAQ